MFKIARSRLLINTARLLAQYISDASLQPLLFAELDSRCDSHSASRRCLGGGASRPVIVEWNLGVVLKRLGVVKTISSLYCIRIFELLDHCIDLGVGLLNACAGRLPS